MEASRERDDVNKWKDTLWLLLAVVGFFVCCSIPYPIYRIGWITEATALTLTKWQAVIYVFCVAPVFVKMSGGRSN